MKKGLILVVVVGIAAVLGFLVQHQVRSGANVTPAPAAANAPATTPATSALPADATAAPAGTEAKPADLVIPTTLPHFELADRDGKKRSLDDWKGRPLMVNYWASWCGPCRREIPLLNQLRAERKAQKLEIVGIAVDFKDDVLTFLKTNPISYPLLIGEEDGIAAVHAMGVEPAFPFTVFADSKQDIVALKIGELHRDEADLILDRVAKVDAGTLPLPEARQQITEGLKELAEKRAAAKPAAG
ncbi:MAG: TlpA disulfide reductase family protein [Pseudomonadota bacterium]